MNEINDENFEKEVIEKSKELPVLVDFWADWCGPCLILKPLLEKIAKDYEGKMIFIKANVDKNPINAENFEVMSIPTIKLIKNGSVIDQFVGLMPEQSIRDWLDKNL